MSKIWGRGRPEGEEVGRKAMTLEIYKPRTDRNSKQLNKTLVEMEMVRCSPTRSGLNSTLANKTKHIL
jgi:hypothetical protein